MGRPRKERPNRSDNLYEVKIKVGETFDGKAIRKSFYSKVSKADARQKGEDYKINQAVAEQTGMPLQNKTSFEKWANKWLEIIKPTIRGNTYYAYELCVNNHLMPYFCKSNLNDIKQIDIQTFFNKLSKKYRKETMLKIKNCLSSIFELAVSNDLCIKNPCDKIKISSEIEDIIKNIYTQEHTDLILEYAKTHKYGLEISLMLAYGLRRGELLGLRWEDVNSNNNVIYIRQAVSDVTDTKSHKSYVEIGKPKTSFSVRDIPISKEYIEKFSLRQKTVVVNRNIKKGRQGRTITPELVFCNSIGGPYSPHNWSTRNYKSFMTDMQNYYKSKNIEVPIYTPHELRHTRASLWVNSDMNLFMVAALLGHSDLKMLRERYAHPDIESIRKSFKIE